MDREIRDKINKEFKEFQSQETIEIVFTREWRNREFKIRVRKPRNMPISIYMADEIMFSEMNIGREAKYSNRGKPTYKESLHFSLVKVLDITEIEKGTPKKKPDYLFERFKILK